MGIAGMQRALPDTSGLPEYFINDWVVAPDGPNVRIVVGCKRGTDTYWLYSCVCPAENLILGGQTLIDIAQEAFNLMQLRMERSSSLSH
jgi:hypothetical protein